MNIFYLSNDPVLAAEYQCDKHVVKMILESAQMLCTAHRVLDGVRQKVPSKNGNRMVTRFVLTEEPGLDEMMYQATHFNHPCNVWIREGDQNYRWLREHFFALCAEYTYRYKKRHLSEIKLGEAVDMLPINIPTGETPVALAMPDEFKTQDPVESYRAYYRSKQHTVDMRWTTRPKPNWF